jgi:hypothetical protein
MKDEQHVLHPLLTHHPSVITAVGCYPCRCLCRGFAQRILTTPRRRTTLHFAQIGLTDDFTFMGRPAPT